MRKLFRVLAALVATATASAAPAAIVDLYFDVYATGFIIVDYNNPSPPPPPYDPVIGRFHTKFDNADFIDHRQGGITVESFNVPFSGPLYLSYLKSSDQVLIGTDTGVGYCELKNNGFCIDLFHASDLATHPDDPNDTVDYGIGSTFYLYGTTVRIRAVTSDVPEPRGWALMLAGFGLLGGALRRQRRAPVTA